MATSIAGREDGTVRRRKLPGGADDWLSPQEAAELWTRVMGPGYLIVRPASEETMRRLCRDGKMQEAGVDVIAMPGRYYILRPSLLGYIVKCCAGVRARAEEEARKST